jgi:hypothetical protein
MPSVFLPFETWPRFNAGFFSICTLADGHLGDMTVTLRRAMLLIAGALHAPAPKWRTEMPTGHVFTPEQIQIMHKAFEIVWSRLHLRPGERAAEEVAVAIVDFAVTGIVNVEELTAATLAAAQGWGEFGALGPKSTERAA